MRQRLTVGRAILVVIGVLLLAILVILILVLGAGTDSGS